MEYYLTSSYTEAVYFPQGEDFLASFLEELENAQRHIVIEFFIIKRGIMWDSILEILKRKASEGVEVYVLYDGLACLFTLPPGYRRTLRKLGISCMVFRSPCRPNNRNHRKIAVIDGDIAFCGGLNLADNYINIGSKYGHWKDSAVMVRWGAGKQTASIWFDSPDELISKQILLDFIGNARDYIYITTPYLSPGEDFINAICAASRRGTDVRLLLPFIPDKFLPHAISKSNYLTLLEAGVRLFEYTPGFIHSKNIVADDLRAAVSTVNLDYRALYTNYECGICLDGQDIIADIKRDFIKTQSISREVTLESHLRAGWWTRSLRRMCRVLAPLV